MSSYSSLDKILAILSGVKNEEEKLKRILSFLESEILPEIEHQKNEIKIPKKYEALVHMIAEAISTGSICHLSLDTLEVEDYDSKIDPEDWEAVTGEKFEFKYLHWKNVLTFEPFESSDAFRLMEDFAAQVENIKVQNILIDILNRRKPFGHFNSFIHNSNYREEWFVFRDKFYEKHVRELLYDKLNEVEEDSNK